MRRITSSLVAVGSLAGIAGAVVAYQAASASPSADQRPAAAVAGTTSAPKPVVRVRMLPCEHGTKLVKEVCVRVRHRVVERPAAVDAVAPAAAPVATTGRSRGHHAAKGRNHGPSSPETSGSGPATVEPGEDAGEDHGTEPGEEPGEDGPELDD
jgi:hypothetical protein